ncbi:hypothetical protein [Leminorella grimontii]|uniref:hypothetical protein n=1 Tax=Leminorella grimontii TaxID=82981 RepID=UPI0032207740
MSKHQYSSTDIRTPQSFQEKLDFIAKHPGMFAYPTTIHAIITLLEGFETAFLIHTQRAVLHAWRDWSYGYLAVTPTSTRWADALLRYYGSHEDAIRALPALYQVYLEQHSLDAVIPHGLPQIPDSADRHFHLFLKDLATSPTNYVMEETIEDIRILLVGYSYAFNTKSQYPLGGWVRWIELHFLIRSAAWSWAKILLHAYGDNDSAIRSLPDLYEKFLIQRAQLGVKGIEQELEKQLISTYGHPWHYPLNEPYSD